MRSTTTTSPGVAGRASRLWPALLAVMALASGLPAGASSNPAVRPAADAVTSLAVARPAVAPALDRVVTAARAATLELTAQVDEAWIAGSGTVVDADRGLVVTNTHVAFGASRIIARTARSTQVEASVVGVAPCDDIAVLRLADVPPGVREFPLGDSDAVEPGGPVIAVGYPVLPDGSRVEAATVTTGEVTTQPKGLENAATTGPAATRLLPHSAPIRPGDSGGPVIDRTGRLLGINTLVGYGAIEGLTLAVPVSRVARLVPDLAAGRDLLDVGWGLVALTDPLYLEFAPQGQADRYAEAVADTPGLWVSVVQAGSAADGAVVPGDYVTEVAGEPVATASQVCAVLARHRGETVRVDARYLGSAAEFERDDGEAFYVEVDVP